MGDDENNGTGVSTMPDPIRYDLKSDRELLVSVAQAINALNEKVANLCVQVGNHEKLLQDSREDRLEIHALLKSSADIAKITAGTLEEINLLLGKNTERIDKIERVVWILKWLAGVITAIIVGVIIYVISSGLSMR